MTDLILTSLHGHELGLSKNRNLAANGFVSGLKKGNNIRHQSPITVSLFDDFLGDVVADQWNFVEGTDSSTSDGAIVALPNGVFRLTPGDSTGTIAADGAQLNSELNWQANQGNLSFQTRLKLAEITSVRFFAGFTDTKALEAAFSMSGTTLTSNATDAVGFLFDTGSTVDTFKLVGVKADADAATQEAVLSTAVGTIAPVAATYITLRIDVSDTGAATFYIDDKQVGVTMANAVTITVPLTPVIQVHPLSAAAGKLVDIDYIHVAANRV